MEPAAARSDSRAPAIRAVRAYLDVEVVLAVDATIPASEVALLWERLDLVATRFRHAETFGRLAPASVTINRTDTHRTAALLLASELHMYLRGGRTDRGRDRHVRGHPALGVRA